MIGLVFARDQLASAMVASEPCGVLDCSPVGSRPMVPTLTAVHNVPRLQIIDLAPIQHRHPVKINTVAGHAVLISGPSVIEDMIRLPSEREAVARYLVEPDGELPVDGWAHDAELAVWCVKEAAIHPPRTGEQWMGTVDGD